MKFTSSSRLLVTVATLLLLVTGRTAFAADTRTPGHLLNISTRARIGTGDDIVVCGLVVTGESPRTVLVRVLGPSLRQFGVADAVADPVVQLVAAGASAPIATNDNWRDGDAAAVIATGLAPYDPLDCALVVALEPGAYTALVSGRGGGTGIALVEAYDLDEPAVSGTIPAKNSTEASTTSTSVTFSFNRPMAPELDVDPGAVWGASSYEWSNDRRQVTLTRINAATPLPAQARIYITLNPPTGSRRTRDTHGNILPTFTLSFAVGVPSSTPYVVSTSPEPGLSVEPTTAVIVFSFSEPMAGAAGGISSGWFPYTTEWSADMKTMRVTRSSATPLQPGATIFFRLPSTLYKSATGVAMAADYELSFTVGVSLQRIEADPLHGFQWPYYLVIPPAIAAPATLLVEPNNTGTVDDNPARHEIAAESLARGKAGFASTIGSPLLVPAFPRPVHPPAPEPGGIYTHSLDRFSLQMTGSPIERLDRQLLAMVEDARPRLGALGINISPKFFMLGFSASGMFTSRFSLLHPDRLKAAACGSPGGWPIAPVAIWRGVNLRYPCGISDLPGLVGEQPDIPAFTQLPLFIFVGSADTNDALDTRGMTTAERAAINNLLSYPTDPFIANRWATAEAIYRSVGSTAVFKVYPGVGHFYSTDMLNDLATFFAAHR